MLEKVKSILNAWWFEATSTALLGVAFLVFGHKFFAGAAIGWALNRIVTYLRS